MGTVQDRVVPAGSCGVRVRVPPRATCALASARPGLAVVVFALVADYADPALFAALPETAKPIAAGPGWDPTRLPPAIPQVNDLTTATLTVNDYARQA
jgi:hypothetical protein